MGIVKNVILQFKKDKVGTFEEEKNKLIKFLKELKELESKLWGVTLRHLQTGEEEVLEDTNHLIYLISRDNHQKLKTLLNSSKLKDFRKSLNNLKSDFLYLKRKIRKKDTLKNLISNFTIKLVDKENYMEMESIFLLEKNLYDVLDFQENELNELMDNLKLVKNFETNEEKLNLFIDSLKELRGILAGNQDLHNLWSEDRYGFSNTSNIINELINMVKSIE